MGKTTINKYLKNEFSKIGLNVIILLDDFYFEYKVLKDKLKSLIINYINTED